MAQSFSGGIHPNDGKAATNHKPIETLPPPTQVVLPMSLHIGAPCKPCVAVGDRVTVGQLVGEATALVSAAVHASVSGRVVAVEPRPHYSGVSVMSVVIENDFSDTPAEPLAGAGDLTPEQLAETVRAAGIVGMGGATFPTHAKLLSTYGKIDTVILNASECEPYVTSDHRLLLEDAQAVVQGATILARAFHVDRAHIGIEDNKRDAVEHLKRVIDELKAPVVLDLLHTCYPQGVEKQICLAVTGRQVPPGALPAAIGCAVFNVSTAAAIFYAVTQGKALTHRVVTVSGSGVREPRNLLCPIGTPIRELLDACGGVDKNTFKIIMGGPMMGSAQYDMDAPIGKGTNAILAFCKDEERSARHPVCIRCGKCAAVCPMHLQPVFLYQYEQAGMLDKLEANHLMDCMECGSCSYICPGRLHLVQAIRTGKQKLNNAKAAAKAAAK